MPNTTYTPTWRKYEKDANNQEDPERALIASDKFIAEREHAMKTDPQARQWEEGRKKELAKAKPKYIKDRIKKEREEELAPIKSLKQIGSFNEKIKPAPGFLLVSLEKQETKTESGIVLPEQVNKDPNMGIVVEISEPLKMIGDNGVIEIECPLRVGDKILFKRYAGALGSPGAEITIKGKELRLMRWHYNPVESDILGVFE